MSRPAGSTRSRAAPSGDASRRWRAAGTTVVITTHFMEEAEYCDRIVIQDAGQLLAIGTPGEVRARVAGATDMNAAFIGIVEQHRAQSASAVAGVA
jgi:ABC-2 type transport system ATP-binding protein